MVFPELCVTGYTCSDLFSRDVFWTVRRKSLLHIADETKDTDALIFVGLPLT